MFKKLTVSMISCEILLHKLNLFNPYESLCARIISIYETIVQNNTFLVLIIGVH